MSNIQSDYERPKRERLDLPDLTIDERNMLLLARILFNYFRNEGLDNTSPELHLLLLATAGNDRLKI